MDDDKINTGRRFPFEVEPRENTKNLKSNGPRIKASARVNTNYGDKQTNLNTPALLKAQIIDETKVRTESIDPELYEKQYVHNVYSIIAPHFSKTRYSVWRLVELFCLNCVCPGMKFLDCGCGNGKNLAAVKPGVDCVAVDYSAELLEHASGIARNSLSHLIQTTTKTAQNTAFTEDEALQSSYTDLPGVITPSASFIRGDIINLPLKSNTFDRCICIAVIHHMTTKERRLQAMRELVRVLKPGGVVLIAVWASKQEERDFLEQKKPTMTPTAAKEGADTLVPWTLYDKELYDVVDKSKDKISAKIAYYENNKQKKKTLPKKKTREFNETVKNLMLENKELKYEDALELARKKLLLSAAYSSNDDGDRDKQTMEENSKLSAADTKSQRANPKACPININSNPTEEKADMRVIDRFYHMFSLNELAELARGIEDAEILTAKNDDDVKTIQEILYEEAKIDVKRKVEVSESGEIWNRGNWHIFIRKRLQSAKNENQK